MTEAVQVETPKPGITVVTNENFDAYVADRVPAPVVEGPEETPEAKAAVELEKVEKEKAERVAKDEEIDHPDKEKKGKLNERFSELTAKRKAAEEAAAQAKAEAKAAKDALEAAERRASELQQKYEPPPSDDIGPKPTRAAYADDAAFEADLEEWASNKVRVEDRKAAKEKADTEAREAVAKSWSERQAKYKEVNPEYEAKIAASDVKVSDQVQQAIVESDVGPQLLLHLAENPEFATGLGKMTVAKALREIGKLEAKFEAGEKTPEPATKLAEISKAPAPIDPIRNANSPVVRLSGSDDVPKNWTYEQWKKARQAGKIQ